MKLELQIVVSHLMCMQEQQVLLLAEPPLLSTPPITYFKGQMNRHCISLCITS